MLIIFAVISGILNVLLWCCIIAVRQLLENAITDEEEYKILKKRYYGYKKKRETNVRYIRIYDKCNSSMNDNVYSINNSSSSIDT